MSNMDDLTTFLGTIPPEEHEVRSRIRTCRNAAAFKVTRTDSADARQLCWMVTETATAWIYTPASVEELQKVVIYLRDMLRNANRIEQLEAMA
jgi:hypothetical protein